MEHNEEQNYLLWYERTNANALNVAQGVAAVVAVGISSASVLQHDGSTPLATAAFGAALLAAALLIESFYVSRITIRLMAEKKDYAFWWKFVGFLDRSSEISIFSSFSLTFFSQIM